MFGVEVWQTWTILILSTLHCSRAYRLYYESMKCSYGERGSLTATCVNVNAAGFFKSTPYRFDHLDETLQCLNCSLKTVDPNTFDISGNQIKHLILKDSGIDALDQRAFVGLVFLRDLDLSNNIIRMIPPGTFAGVKKIEMVNLNNNSLALLSNDGFVELGNLNTLILSQNKIADIELNSFSGLKNLKILNLNHNRISNVTSIFNNLTTLQYLDLSDNIISELKGNEFENLTSLLELKFDNNKIKTLPSAEFVCMSSLAYLGLSNNFIQQIGSKAFEGLNTLETLDLGNNQIATIPEKTFRNMHSLINMNLTGNKLEIFQVSRFAGLPKLRILNLSHNRIENIDVTGIFPMHDLHSLDLSSNNLTDLNYVVLLHRMPRISYLALQNNYWPCDLEDELDKFFSGENFKFILFERKNGSIKCNENFVRKELDSKLISVEDVVHSELTAASSSSASQIYMFLMIIVISIAVLILSYGQYRISKELRFNPLLMRRRTTSEVKLFQSDIHEEDNDYMK